MLPLAPDQAGLPGTVVAHGGRHVRQRIVREPRQHPPGGAVPLGAEQLGVVHRLHVTVHVAAQHQQRGVAAEVEVPIPDISQAAEGHLRRAPGCAVPDGVV